MYKQSIILCFVIHSVICLEKFLQFYANPDLTDRKTVYELDLSPIKVDAYQTSQILIKYIQYIRDLNFPNIHFYCNVKPLDANYKINNALLCKKDSLSSKEDCHSITKDIQIVKFGEIMKFDVNYDTQTGITATLNMDIKLVKARTNAFDGFYYCKLTNFFGSISSNYIEIQDFEFYKQNLSNLTNPIIKDFEPTPIKDFNTNSFPIYIDCGKSIGNSDKSLPKWVNKDMISPFGWTLCLKPTSGIDCFSKLLDNQRQHSRPLEDVMEYYQFPNGTIAMMGIKSFDFEESGLVCTSKSLPPQRYAIYLTQVGKKWRPIKYLKFGNFSKKIQRLSPMTVSVVIREGSYDKSRFKLYASYVANPDHTKVTAEWKKDGYVLPSTFGVGNFQLILPTEITEEHMGNYVLKVSQSEPYDSISFNYFVTVVGVPRLRDKVNYSPILYRTEDQTVNISASFDRNITRMSIEINGILIDSSSDMVKTNSVKDLVYIFPFMTGIKVNSKFEINDGTGKAIYEVRDLFRNKNAREPKTHTVTFIGENDFGVSKMSVLVRVFENPVFTSYLNIFNCTINCKNSERHVFKCSINETEYLAEGLTIKYLWSLNGLSINSMNKVYDQKAYLQMVNDSLIIDPIQSDNKERDKRMVKILTNATLSCQIIIYEPIKFGRAVSEKLYTTESNPDLKSLLEAKINLQFNPIDSASASWILPFIISLIVLLVIAVLILYFCLRGSGETYNVDQKERAQGHDPEKEIRDNEIFQPYERDHETNVVQPSHLSFNDDDSVGVGSDDGELDVYDIDPGKFNEEGSFIGKYASDPRRHKVNSETTR